MYFEVNGLSLRIIRMGKKCTQPSLSCSAVRFVHAALVCGTRRSRRRRHRYGPGQASPALCPCEPRRSPSGKKAVLMDKNLYQLLSMDKKKTANNCRSYLLIGRKGEQIRGYKQKIPLRAPFGAPRSPSLALMRSVVSAIRQRA